MPNLLAIDTSSANCTVALLVADKLTSRTLEAGGHTGQQVLPLLAEVMAAAGVGLEQVDAITVVAGPGSFTGIRIGIGVAQGLSMAHNTPVLPLSVLALKAFAAMRMTGTNLVLVSDMARDSEVYFAAFRQSPITGVELLGAEQVGTPADILLDPACFETGEGWVAAGDGWAGLAVIRQQLGGSDALPPSDSTYSARDICDLAKLRFLHGDALPAELALPNYVKDTLNYTR